jgi:P4 family phage/plasmid primase-like protien
MNPLKITIFKTVKANEKEEIAFSTWDELFHYLTSNTYPSKADCPLFKMARFGDKRSATRSLRHNENIVAIAGIEADYDAGKMTILEAKNLLENAGIAAFLYTTATHTNEHPRWRVVCPTSKESPPHERAKFMGRINGVLGGVLAGESFTLSQAFYYGAIEGQDFETCQTESWGNTVMQPIDLLDSLDEKAIGKPGTVAYTNTGGELVESSLETIVEKVDVSLDDARTVLLGILPSVLRDKWLRVLMGLHHNFDGSDEAMKLADQWSSGSLHGVTEPKYMGIADIQKRWRSFDGNNKKSVSFATVIALYKETNESRLPDCIAAKKSATVDATETGLVVLFLQLHPGQFKYVAEMNQWIEWRGNNWKVANAAYVRGCISDTLKTVKELPPEGYTDAEIKKFRSALQNAKTAKGVFYFLQSHKDVLIEADLLDRNLDLLGCENGSIDLTTGTLKLPDRGDYITQSTNLIYDPEATAPLWEKTLLEIFAGDTDKVSYLQRHFGYALLGKPVEQIFSFMVGAGANGKSTLMNTFLKVSGDYGVTVNMSTLVDAASFESSAGAPRADLVALQGKRVVVASESDANGKLKAALLKNMSGGEVIAARRPHATEQVYIRPTWSIFMVSNHLPTISDRDHGIWRRVVVIAFLRNFMGDPTVTKDPHLERKLLTEATGILAWLVRGALEYRMLGLLPPESITRAASAYRCDMDYLAEWLKERCVVEDDAFTTSAAAYFDFKQWAALKGYGEHVRSVSALAKKLHEFPRGEGKHGRGKRGFRLIHPPGF